MEGSYWWRFKAIHGWGSPSTKRLIHGWGPDPWMEDIHESRATDGSNIHQWEHLIHEWEPVFVDERI